MVARKDEPKTVRELHEHLEACRTDVDARFDKGNKKMDMLHSKTDANVKAIEDLTKSIDQFLVIWSALNGFAKVVNWTAKAAKVVGIIALGIAAVGAFFHFGGHK